MKDFKDEIAEKFIKAMEEGAAPWQKVWSSSQYILKKRCNRARIQWI
ncbi:MAG: DUF1738 domain-containing protein [Alphaproteobacteria bacterium]|nr:DUF1738 domain-containing protein [Alphaproteobacteria bacterium]